jgi:hypothetical protein
VVELADGTRKVLLSRRQRFRSTTLHLYKIAG